MGKTKNAGKKESVVRSVLGSIVIFVSFLVSGIFCLSMGFIGAIIAVSALFKY